MFDDTTATGLLNVPFPFDLRVERVPGTAPASARYSATSPDWPGLRGEGEDALDAIWHLMCEISDAEPLKAEVVEALTRAGHGPDVIEAWARNVRGDRVPLLRHSGGEAVSILADYTSHDVPADLACEFIGVGLSADAAGRVHAAGCTPTGARPYVERLGDFLADRYGETIRTSFASDDDLVEWILSGSTPERADFYRRAWCGVEEARNWDPVVRAHHITADDLRDIRRAGLTLAEVSQTAGDYEAHGSTIGEVARALLALTTPPPRAWDEPPF